jgi:Lon protease-like protein
MKEGWSRVFGPDHGGPRVGSLAKRADLEAALEALPIFPLPQIVLFPQTILPLHVFEPRYRALLKDCLATHGGLALAKLTGPAGDGTLPPIASVAGAGIIVEHQPLSDGRANILLHGCARVMLEELPFVPPYRRARATILVDACESVAHSDRAALLACAEAFAAEIRQHNPEFSFRIPANLEAGALSDYCAHHLLVDAGLRQRLLEELRPAERVRIVTEELALQHSAMRQESGGFLH